MNTQTKNQQEEEKSEYDSFLNSWKIDRNPKESFGLASGFLDRFSIFSGSVISQASQKLSNHVQSNKQAFEFPITGNQMETISLSDMLKTNCSHQELNYSIGNMAVFDKVTHQRRQGNGQTDAGDDGLEMVSNRKLQNRVNSKRARERKKEQWQQMKETINQLEIENRALRKSIQRQYENKNIKCSKKYCRKCQSQMRDSSQEEDHKNKQKTNSNQTSVEYQQADKKNEYKSFQKQYLRVFLKSPKDQEKKRKSESKYLYEKPQEKDYKQFQKWVQGEGKEIWKRGTQYIEQKQKYGKFYMKESQQTVKINKLGSKQKQSKMELQFEEIDFFGKTKQSEKIKKKKNINGERRWVGKVWIALSIIMMVIGVQMHGLQGNGEKSIRVSEFEAKNWAVNLQNQDVEELTIKMKTKIPNAFIENQKQLSEGHSKWKQKWNLENYHQNQEQKMEGEIQQRKQPLSKRKKSLDQSFNRKNPSNWLQSISFETQQSYNRLIQDEEEQTELKIDKDLLFSIQAEFDDIGMYI